MWSVVILQKREGRAVLLDKGPGLLRALFIAANCASLQRYQSNPDNIIHIFTIDYPYIIHILSIYHPQIIHIQSIGYSYIIHRLPTFSGIWTYWVKVVTYAAVIFLCRKQCASGKCITYVTFWNDEPVVYDSICLAHFAGHTGFGTWHTWTYFIIFLDVIFQQVWSILNTFKNKNSHF